MIRECPNNWLQRSGHPPVDLLAEQNHARSRRSRLMRSGSSSKRPSDDASPASALAVFLDEKSDARIGAQVIEFPRGDGECMGARSRLGIEDDRDVGLAAICATQTGEPVCFGPMLGSIAHRNHDTTIWYGNAPDQLRGCASDPSDRASDG